MTTMIKLTSVNIMSLCFMTKATPEKYVNPKTSQKRSFFFRDPRSQV